MSKHACNLISRLNDGYKRKLLYIDIISDASVIQLLKFLLQNGFIQAFLNISQCSFRFRVFLKLNGFFENSLLIRPFMSEVSPQANTYVYGPYRKIVLVSHGSHNVYVKAKHIQKQYLNVNIIVVISTSFGYMSAASALAKNIGGKVCFKIIL